jgi:hypothetical protein
MRMNSVLRLVCNMIYQTMEPKDPVVLGKGEYFGPKLP